MKIQLDYQRYIQCHDETVQAFHNYVCGIKYDAYRFCYKTSKWTCTRILLGTTSLTEFWMTSRLFNWSETAPNVEKQSRADQIFLVCQEPDARSTGTKGQHQYFLRKQHNIGIIWFGRIGLHSQLCSRGKGALRYNDRQCWQGETWSESGG